MAKFGIALEWGSRGRWFDSSHSDQAAGLVRGIDNDLLDILVHDGLCQFLHIHIFLCQGDKGIGQSFISSRCSTHSSITSISSFNRSCSGFIVRRHLSVSVLIEISKNIVLVQPGDDDIQIPARRFFYLFSFFCHPGCCAPDQSCGIAAISSENRPSLRIYSLTARMRSRTISETASSDIVERYKYHGCSCSCCRRSDPACPQAFACRKVELAAAIGTKQKP